MTSSPVLLRFASPVTPTPGPVPMRFGAAEFAAGEAVTGTLAAALPAPDLPGLVLIATAITETELFRDIGPAVIAPHAERDDGGGRAAIGQRSAQPTASRTLAVQQHAAPLAVGQRARQTATLPMQQGATAPHTAADPLAAGQRAHYAEATRTQRRGTAPHQHGHPLRRGAAASYAEASRTRRRARADHQHGTPTVRPATTRHTTGRSIAAPRAERHQHMLPLPVGWWQATYPWPEPPIDPNAPSSPVALKFCRLSDGTTALIFGCPTPQQPDATVVVPIRRAYIVLNSASLTRVSDGAPIPTLSLSISLDSSSWTWGFDASLPAEAQPLVEPSNGPVEVLATINGQSFRLVVESISRERRFGQVGVRISGRGRNAILDAPYSAAKSFTNTGDRTAQQLAADSLLENGVNVGLATIGEAWQVNWGLTDWLVPAGVWVHQGTHISALNAIAQAAGGYLRPDRTAATLHIEPRYPTAPWAWDAVNPDIELPSAVTIQESVQWQDKAPYNRVFVSGQQSGILGQVTRAGTAGDAVAPMVTDALITHADAARQRGISILGDTGRVANVTLSLPVLPETGIIEVGKFVRYVDGAVTRKGIVRSSSVSVGASAVDVRQQITLETHL